MIESLLDMAPEVAIGDHADKVSCLVRHADDAQPLGAHFDHGVVHAGVLVDEALTLFDEHRITTLFVVEDRKPLGVLHIHDCPPPR